ncbi:MAG: hypothetical protein PUH30_03700 [Oscillospiraceae bacterium]|nr:hypothetical protein [Oscillospiraceae bacterium]MDD7278621.1 hypothetical protein [Oscillospiraceae bacterium]
MSEETRTTIIEATAEITSDINEMQNIKAFLNFLADTPQGKEFDKSVIKTAQMLSKVTGCTPLSEVALMYFAFIGGMKAAKENER